MTPPFAEGWSAGTETRDYRLTLIRITFVLFAVSLPFEVVNLGQWSRINTIEGDSSFISISKVAGGLFFLATLLDWRRCYRYFPKALWCFGAYFTLYAAHGVLGDYTGEVLNRVVSRVQVLVLTYAASNLLSCDTTRRLVFTSFGLACAVLSALTISGVLNHSMVQFTESGTLERISGLAEDANNVAGILSLGLLSLISLVLIRRRMSWIVRGLACLGALAIVYAIVRTGSRGGMLALAAGLVAFAIGEPSRQKLARNVVIVAVVMGFTALCLLNWEAALERWQTTLYDGNTAGRDVIVEETCKLIGQKPLLGWGAVTADRVLGAGLGLPTRGTHNLWLSVCLDNGVIGLLPYGLGVSLCLAAAWRARRGEAGVLPLSLIAVVMVANLSLVWDNQKAHWLVLALALASGARSRSLARAKTATWEWLAAQKLALVTPEAASDTAIAASCKRFPLAPKGDGNGLC